jgi:hypothetical protein
MRDAVEILGGAMITSALMAYVFCILLPSIHI